MGFHLIIIKTFWIKEFKTLSTKILIKIEKQNEYFLKNFPCYPGTCLSICQCMMMVFQMITTQRSNSMQPMIVQLRKGFTGSR